MIPFLIVMAIATPVCMWQFFTWPSDEQQRLRRLSRDLRGVRWERSEVQELADEIAGAAWTRTA